jgi:hypothetical protein
MSKEIPIDFQNFVTYVPLIFILVGMARGVRRELLSLLLVLCLNYLVIHPEMAATLLTIANNWLNVLKTVLQNPGIAKNMQSFATAYSQQAPIFTISDPAPFFITLLLVLWALSYVTGGWVMGTEQRSALSAILGGVLGYINASIVISLVRTFALGVFLQPKTAAVANQSMVPAELTVVVSNVPTQTGIPVEPAILVMMIIGAGIAVIWLAFFNRASKKKERKSSKSSGDSD